MKRQRDDSGLYMIGEGAGMGKAGSNAITNSDKLEFAVFCIEHIALHLGISAEKVYDALM